MKYDYLKEALKVLAAIITLLLVVSLVPDFELKYKHFNILSDIVDKPAEDEAGSYSFESLEKELMGTNPDSIDHEQEDSITAPARKVTAPTLAPGEVGLEDFSANNQSLTPFYKALRSETRERSVRIAVVGDSFIESDIITARLRKLLQSKYGGTGVGYIPIVSPVTFSRQSIQTETSGWTVQSIAQYKKADRSKFSLAGFYYTPSEDATVLIKSSASDPARQVTLAFVNTLHTRLQVSVNEQEPVKHTPAASDEVQFLTIADTGIKSLKLTVNDNEGFTALGLYYNNTTGVYVDNYSVRGTSGVELSVISQNLTRQLDKQIRYDLLIIEYGLNVMEADKTNYTSYRRLMIKTIDHVKECYPGVPIILLSIGDRASKNDDGNMSTHPGVSALVTAQRDIAKTSGIVFWNTFNAMGGKNSMVNYVEQTPPLAGKDYAHINHLGGIKVANILFESLMDEEKRLAPALGNEK